MELARLPVHSIDQYPGPPCIIESFESIAAGTWNREPHRHRFYEVVSISSGRGRHVIDLNVLALRPHSLYFIAPGQVHCWNCEAPVHGRVVMFNEQMLLGATAHDASDHVALFHRLSETGGITLSPADARRAESLIDEMERELAEQGHGFLSVVASLLQVMLVRSARSRGTLEPRDDLGRPAVLVRQFIRLVDERCVFGNEVRAYADRLGVTPGHLRDVVKELTGRTPGEFIRGSTIREAKRLLTYTSLTIGQIASEVGFDDIAYFSRFFKRETGQTPGGFRAEIRGVTA